MTLNAQVFGTQRGSLAPRTDAVNEAGGVAYARSPKEELAQLAATGCFSNTFYVTGEVQLERLLATCTKVVEAEGEEFIAKCAVYAHQRGLMKDTPAVMLAWLAAQESDLVEAIWPRIVTNGRMLRGFVQAIRSGSVGRKSFGTRLRRCIRAWLEARPFEKLINDSVGQTPSLADIVKMAHPKPADKARAAFYGWLLGKAYDKRSLPAAVREYERFKADSTGTPPAVDFRLLSSIKLSSEQWGKLAGSMGWQALRMNLNTLQRNGAFELPGVVENVVKRLKDPAEIKRSRVFPYQLLVAYLNAHEVPADVRNALQDALEIAIDNVPELPGKTYLCCDISGSMSSPVTGERKGATTDVSCVQVAGLLCAALLRRNQNAEVIVFNTGAQPLQLNPRDSVMTNASRLTGFMGGGTNCSAPLALLNKRGAYGDNVIYVSDNESWVDRRRPQDATVMMSLWGPYKQRNPEARLACIDLTPDSTKQMLDREDILNVGGFSDAVFEVLSRFFSGGLTKARWIEAIEEVTL